MSREQKRVTPMTTAMEKRTFLMEFPPETVALIDRLCVNLHLERDEVFSKALGLLDVWEEAHRKQRIIVERPANGTGEEFKIEID